MVTQTWGCARAAALASESPARPPSKETTRRLIMVSPAHPALWRHHITDWGGKEAQSRARRTTGRRRSRLFTGNLHAGRAAVGARVVTALERPVGMEHHRAGVPHDICVG